MAKAKKSEPIRLTVEQIAEFQKVVAMILAVDKKQEAAKDYEGGTEVLNQLYYSMPEHEFERFKQIICDADDSEFRCPK